MPSAACTKIHTKNTHMNIANILWLYNRKSVYMNSLHFNYKFMPLDNTKKGNWHKLCNVHKYKNSIGMLVTNSVWDIYHTERSSVCFLRSKSRTFLWYVIHQWDYYLNGLWIACMKWMDDVMASSSPCHGVIYQPSLDRDLSHHADIPSQVYRKVLQKLCLF